MASTTAAHRKYLESLLYYDRGSYDEARVAAEELLERLRDEEHQVEDANEDAAGEGQEPARHRTDHILFSNTLLLLANIAATSPQRIDQALELYHTTEAYLMEHLGENFVGIATCRLNCALTLLGMQGLDHISAAKAALPLLEDCEKMLENVVTANRILLSDVLHNMGCCNFRLQNYSEAIECFVRSLKIRERFNNSSDGKQEIALGMAMTMSCLAVLLRLSGDTQEAIKVLEAVVMTEQEIVGSLSFQVASTLTQLGHAHKEAGHLNSARDCYQRVFDIYVRQLGEEEMETLQAADRLMELEEVIASSKQHIAQRDHSFATSNRIDVSRTATGGRTQHLASAPLSNQERPASSGRANSSAGYTTSSSTMKPLPRARTLPYEGSHSGSSGVVTRDRQQQVPSGRAQMSGSVDSIGGQSSIHSEGTTSTARRSSGGVAKPSLDGANHPTSSGSSRPPLPLAPSPHVSVQSM